MGNTKPLYKRVLLKLSGEALMGTHQFGISKESCNELAQSIKAMADLGVQFGIVIGGGNIFRGLQGSQALSIQRAQADYVGMLATLMNALIFQEALASAGLDCRIMSSLKLLELTEPAQWNKAIDYLEKGRVIIFAGGTGNPYFTTDTAAALRASEIQADILLKGTKVEGVYNKDPKQFSDAIKYDTISFTDALDQHLKVMDATAISLCRDNEISIKVFNSLNKNALKMAIFDPNFGTLIQGE